MFGMLQGAINALQTKKANKRLDELLAQDPTYKENPLARQRFGLANQLFGARMFGASDLQKNILSGQGTYNAAVNRNATDASQALAMAAAGQGNTDKQFQNLQTAEAQNKYNLLGNLNNAYEGLIGEGDKAYNDQVRRYGDLSQIRGAQQQNRYNAVNGVFNGLNSDINQAISAFGAFTGMGGGMGGGGFGKAFSGGGAGGSGQPITSWAQIQGGRPNIDYGLINSSYPKF